MMGQQTSHLHGHLQRTSTFLKEQIKPVYVFDGEPPEEKNKEITQRYLNRRAADEELSALTGVEHLACRPASKKARCDTLIILISLETN